MKAIILSSESFLVKTDEHSTVFGGKVIKISTKDTMNVPRYNGGDNENVPVYDFSDAEWEQAEKRLDVEDLSTLTEHEELFYKVSVAEEEQFQSEDDYLLEQVVHFM